MKHIEFEAILNDRENRLEEPVAAHVAGHLAECVECAATARRIDRFLEFAVVGEVEVPQAVTATLLNIYQPKKEAAGAPSVFQRIVAALTFDDWQTTLSERFDGRDSRQLLFRAGEFEVDLRLEFSTDKCRVAGQVFGGEGSGLAELVTDGQAVSASITDDFEFFFAPVAKGVYLLRLQFAGEIIEIPGIELNN